MSSAAAVIEASERINEVHIEGLVCRQLLLDFGLYRSLSSSWLSPDKMVSFIFFSIIVGFVENSQTLS